MTEQAQSADVAPQRPSGRHPWLVAGLSLLLLAVIAGFLSAQTYFQDGVPLVMANWQFARFGQALPIFNIAIFVAIAVLVGLLIDFLVRLVRGRRKIEGMIDPAADHVEARQREAERELASAKASAGRFARLLTIIGGVVMGIASLIALWALLLPARAETVVFGAPSGQANRAIAGRPDGRLMVTTVNDILLYRDSAFFVPVIDPAEPRVIRRFVEFVPDGSWDGSAVPQVDVSRPFRAYRLALPAFTPTLYAGNGYRVEKPYEVLTNRAISIQLPYFITAVQLGLIGLVILVAAWIQRRHAGRSQSRTDEIARA